MKLETISFPVYELLNTRPIESKGKVFYTTEIENIDTGVRKTLTRYVDDKTLAGETLAERRLAMVGLYDLYQPHVIYLVSEFLRIAETGAWFIDNNGVLFMYKKSTMAVIKCYKIKKVLPTSNLGCILEIDGIPTRLRTLAHVDAYLHQYAAILTIGKGYLLYGFCAEPFEPTRRKV